MKKILYLSSSTSLQGGAELCLLKIAEHFNNSSRFQVITVLPDNRGIVNKYYQAGIPICIIRFERLRKIKSLWIQLCYIFYFLCLIFKIFKIIREEHVELIHVNEIIDFQGLIAGKLARIPTVCHVRVIVEQPIAKRIFVWILEHFANRVICVSQAVKKRMFEGEKISQEKIRVVYDGGPDSTIFEPNKYNGNIIREEFGIGNEVFLIGFVSKIVEINGQIYLVEAANKLYRKGFHDIYYMFVGGKVDGHEAYFQEIRSLIESYGLENQFIWAGFREDVPQIMESCDILLNLPICEHSFPGVVLEAMAMEKPVIAFQSGGIPEQFVGGRSGYLVPKGDIDLLVGRILNLYNNPDKRYEIGKNAREHLLKNFSLNRHFRGIEEIYNRLLKGK